MRLDERLPNLIRTISRGRRPLPAAAFLAAIVVVATLTASHTFLLTSDTAHGANSTVIIRLDGADINPGDGICSASGFIGCTLRAAIMNSLDGDDTITLTAGTFTLTLAGANENAAMTSDLDVVSMGQQTIAVG